MDTIVFSTGQPDRNEKNFDEIFNLIYNNNIDLALEKIKSLPKDLSPNFTKYKRKPSLWQRLWKQPMDILDIAIAGEHWKLVKYLADNFPNAKFSNIGHAIFRAVAIRKYDLAKTLVDTYAKNDTTLLDWKRCDGYTTLHILLFQNTRASFEMAAHLLKNDADPNTRNITYGPLFDSDVPSPACFCKKGTVWEMLYVHRLKPEITDQDFNMPSVEQPLFQSLKILCRLMSATKNLFCMNSPPTISTAPNNITSLEKPRSQLYPSTAERVIPITKVKDRGLA